MPGLDSLARHNAMLYAPLYESVLTLLGTTGIILPLGDFNHGQPNATSFKTVGGEQVDFTWDPSGHKPSTFDIPLDLTDPASYQGIIPIIDFNGSDEAADTPDASYWSRALGAFSLGMWVHLDSIGGNMIFMAKDDVDVQREWWFGIGGSNKMHANLFDESGNYESSRPGGTALVIGRWYYLIRTYDGGGGGTAANGLHIYMDGALDDGTAVNNGSFVALEDLGAVVALGSWSGGGSFFNGRMAGGPLGPFFTQTELSADAIKRLYNLGRAALGV